MENKLTNFIPSNKVYMIIITILIAILFINKNFIEGGVALVVFGTLVIYNIKAIKQKKIKWKKYIEDFSSNLNLASKEMLIKFPFPLVLINREGNILWCNENSTKVMKKDNIIGMSLRELIKDIDIQGLVEEEGIVCENTYLNEKYYDIYYKIVETIDTREEILMCYMHDITAFHDIQIEMEAKKESVILIEVDNLEEALKSIQEDSKPLFIAEIERIINSYAQSINALVKKYSSDKYIVSIQEIDLQGEILKNFDILDTIRDLNLGNQLAISLSIGIGRGGKTPLENYNFALAAKDLALGRGGDQAVIKSRDKLLFYGGKTKEVEKRTKVRARVIAQSLAQLMKESSNIVIMGHVNPDVDCIGAAMGLQRIANIFGKKTYIILDGVNNSIKNIMDKILQDPMYQNIFIKPEECKKVIDDKTLMILVDVHNRSYVQNSEIMGIVKRFVIIDHHRKSFDYFEGAIISYIEPYASSTSEMVTEMLQYMTDTPKINKMEAEALLAGICIDTKNFCFKTGVRTFEAASFLRRLGADTIDIKKMFSNDLDSYLKKADIIKSAKVDKNIAIAACPIEIEDGLIAAQAADELLNITGIQASFIIVKMDEDVLISGRSLGDINVQLILENLGGGGHLTMAGARIKASLEEAVIILKEAIDKYIKEGEKL